MYVLSWFDNRTLIACDFMLSTAFAIVFFGMKRSYPNLRGINTIAISFLLGIPGTFLLASRGTVPFFLSVTIANCFIFGAFVFLYRGILRFLGSRRTVLVPVLVSSSSLAVLFYFSQIQQNIVPRIVAISLTIGLVRGLIALELFRKSPTFTSPTAMRLFAAAMSLFAAVTRQLRHHDSPPRRALRRPYQQSHRHSDPVSSASFLSVSRASSSWFSPAAN